MAMWQCETLFSQCFLWTPPCILSHLSQAQTWNGGRGGVNPSPVRLLLQLFKQTRDVAAPQHGYHIYSTENASARGGGWPVMGWIGLQ